MFQKAIKYDAKLRLAISGISGSGKTWTALKLATRLVEGTGKRVALVDTEHGSASKYADVFDFDVVEFEPPFSVDRFLSAITEAAVAGYGAIIIDSLSHAWSGTGGLLEEVDKAAARMKNPNGFAAWKEVTPMYNSLVDGIIRSDVHVLVTMRAKSDYVIEERDGKKTPTKVGLAAIQRDGFEYEFDVWLEMDGGNTAVVSKTRCSDIVGGVFKRPGDDLADTLRVWLNGKALPEMTLDAAVDVLSPGGKRLDDLTDDQLTTLKNSTSKSVTRDMREAAKTILKARSAHSDRAAASQ